MAEYSGNTHLIYELDAHGLGKVMVATNSEIYKPEIQIDGFRITESTSFMGLPQFNLVTLIEKAISKKVDVDVKSNASETLYLLKGDKIEIIKAYEILLNQLEELYGRKVEKVVSAFPDCSYDIPDDEMV